MGETTQGRTGKWAKRLRGERESGRNDSGANGKVGETTQGRTGKWAKRLGANGKVGETTQGRTGKWAKRLSGERESGRNDSGANGKVGETTQGRTGKWAKRLRGERESGRNDSGRTGKWTKRPGFGQKYSYLSMAMRGPEGFKYEPPHDKTNKMVCAPSEDSDQPGHPPSPIRVFATRSMGS